MGLPNRKEELTLVQAALARLWPRNNCDRLGVMRVMMRRVFSLTLVLTLLGSSGAFAQVLYVCQMDGQVHQSCCCEDEAFPSQTAVVEGCGCCSVEIVDGTPAQPAPAQQPPPDNPVSSTVVVSALPSMDLGPSNPAWLTKARALAPHVGPPPFLRLCSFLI